MVNRDVAVGMATTVEVRGVHMRYNRLSPAWAALV